MPLPLLAASEVFSVQEIARAAGVSVGTARQLIHSGRIREREGYVATREAVHCVRQLRLGLAAPRDRSLFAPPFHGEGAPAAGVAGSSGLHAAMLALVLLTTLGLPPAEKAPRPLNPTRLVFLATPGPGGGGGGGGLKMPDPPAKAEMKGTARLESPVPPPRRLSSRKPEPQPARPIPPPFRPPLTPVVETPPPPRPVVTPQVVAPVVTAGADARDRAGLPAEAAPETESQGSGAGAGAGTGQGSGLGEGSGPGIGPGSGGGTGGGPYRSGSGITAPDLLREVRPDYTEDARRLGIEGDVVLEIVVRNDGTVGSVKVLQGLNAGLDRRAVEAVRQWRFSPARRLGTPVDVVVEIAVEFKLR